MRSYTLALLLLAACAASPRPAPAPQLVSFATPDGKVVYGDLYDQGDHAVVLAHGGRFDKESWKSQAQVFAKAGFSVLSIDFRGYGSSGPADASDPYEGLHFDVLGAVRYLRRLGMRRVSVVGASMGGGAAAKASIEAGPGEIDDVVLIAHSLVEHPERLKGRKLFVVARDDPWADGSPRLTEIREQYLRAHEPKELVVLDGSAHAQHVFEAAEGERLMREIVRFLSSR